MATFGLKWKVMGVGMVLAAGASFTRPARGQGAVAFTPQVGQILNGSAMQVTPVVSADRRYVRVSVNAYFNTVNGFTTYTAPLGAVSGGGGGTIGGGGGGGVVGGGGGGIGGGVGAVGGGGVGVGGGFAGMNGPISGMGMPGPMGPMAGYAQTGNYLAGDFPPMAAALGAGGDVGVDAFGRAIGDRTQASPPAGAPDDPAQAADASADPFGFAAVPDDGSVRPAKRSAASRRKAARKSARRPAVDSAVKPKGRK